MRQIWITRPGDVDVLELREAADPVPGPREVRVAVRAAGVNFADILARMGMYPDAPRPPCVVGYDISGTVDACGSDVTGFRPGDRVFGLTHFGGYSTHVCVPEDQLFRLPDNLDFGAGAAIPVNYFTAYLAIHRFGNLQSDERVLIHSAAGGVGTAAIELAVAIGAEVFGTASAAKHAYIRELGCEHPIDYRTADFAAEVSRLTAGEGVHLILDPIGGRNVSKDRRILSPLGRIVVYGVSSSSNSRRRQLLRLSATAMSFPFFHPLTLMNRNQGILGLNLGHLWGQIPRLRSVGERILELVAGGAVSPKAGHTFAFDDVREAHRFIQDRKNTGKVVLMIDG